MLLTISVVLASCGCGSKTASSSSEDRLVKAEKPAVDTAMVLETLELYRAKRFESLQDAMHAGRENVHKMVLYGRKLGEISPEIGKLKYLQTLDVADNDLIALPAELADLHYLQGFYANINRLNAFPEQLLLLPLLKSIDLSDNQITEIPEAISRMDQLTRLTMDNNHLTSFPPALFELKELSVLELAGNGISEVPGGIENLDQLKKLDLSGNQLTSVPEGLTALAGSLKDLYLQGNRIPREDLERLGRALPNTTIRY